MRIDSATIAMESERSYKSTSTSVRRFVLADYRETGQGSHALNAAIDSGTGNAAGENWSRTQEDEEKTAETGEQKLTTMEEWKTRFQATGTNISIRSASSQTYVEIQQHTIRYIFDLLFGEMRDRLSRWLEEATGKTAETGSPVQNSVQGSLQPVGQQGAFTTSMQVFRYSEETIFAEKESTSFSTTGTVKTADGREISFQVNVGMSRQFQERFSQELDLASFTMCDPLVINMDTDAASLSDQTFYFDIDADGEKDEISQLGAGSGYLALDKSGDGVINDGKELFGTASGNGFADLAEYDEDGNGWIDENDEVWNKLKIWTKDAEGRDVLYRLSEKGVGAICLQNAATDYTQKGQQGQTLGAIRNTGIFLYENGNVGTVQHVDVAKYEKEA